LAATNLHHIGHQVVAMMDRLGASPLTRNYHLFYVCIANSSPEIRRAVRNLGRRPSQRELDQVIEKFCPEAVDSSAIQRHENAVLRAIDQAADRLRSEQSQLVNFNNAIARVSSVVAKSAANDRLTADLVLKVAGAIGQAGQQRQVSGQRTLYQVENNRNEIKALRTALVEARRLANTDALTGVANRRRFDDVLANAVSSEKKFALLLADIDHFKQVNDTLGHLAGDDVLRAIGKVLRSRVGAGTFAARTGGEEFALLIFDATAEDAMAAGERFRKAVASMTLDLGSGPLSVTVSLGVALFADGDSVADVYGNADAALYHSKVKGRNRVSLHNAAAGDGSALRYRIYAK